MSRTKRDSDKFRDALRPVTPYKREKRHKIVREFEREYIGHNKSPVIEL